MIKDTFIKNLFSAFEMEWDQVAKAREFLKEAINDDESIEVVLEDLIFSLSQFLDLLKHQNKIPKSTEICVDIEDEEVYTVHVGNEEFSRIVLKITDLGGSVYICESDPPEISCMSNGLDTLKETIVIWAKSFNKRND